MTAEVVTSRSIEACSRHTAGLRFRERVAERLKAVVLGTVVASIGVVASLAIGPAFVQRGLELADITLPLLGVTFNILPGVGMMVGGAGVVAEGVTGRTNRIVTIMAGLLQS